MKDWGEFDRLKDMPNLQNLLFTGNPLQSCEEIEAYRMQVLKRLPNLKVLDGVDVTDDEVEKAASA